MMDGPRVASWMLAERMDGLDPMRCDACLLTLMMMIKGEGDKTE